MEASPWIAQANALSPLVIASVSAPVVARIAMNRRRAEMVGKRKAELAEAVLADVYRVRRPLEQEGADRENGNDHLRFISECNDLAHHPGRLSH